MKLPRPGPATDQDGKGIVFVQVRGAPAHAKLLREDAERLKGLGLCRDWSWAWVKKAKGLGMVRYKFARGHTDLEVARWVIGTTQGFRVKYRDGDHLNLRRDNLDLVPGKPMDGRLEDTESIFAMHRKFDRDALKAKHALMSPAEQFQAELEAMDEGVYLGLV